MNYRGDVEGGEAGGLQRLALATKETVQVLRYRT